MSKVAVTITYEIENQVKTLVLSSVDDTSVSGSSNITEYPLATGDISADHMIKQPTSLSLSGTFSLNGSDQLLVDSSGIKLADFEDIFETIQKNAILCEIVKVTVSEQSGQQNKARFLRRSNMALQSFSWTEGISSVGYSLTFRQIQMAEITEEDVKEIDETLPDITEPETLNFTDTLFDVSQFDVEVINVLKSTKLIEDDFLDYLKTMTASGLVALGIGLTVAALVASIPGVGQAAVLVTAAIAATAIIVVSLCKFIKRKINEASYRYNTFRYYKNKKKREKETQRFCQFEEDMHSQLDQLNSILKVFKISSNQPQECLLTIGTNIYDFLFTRDNTTNTYKLNVTNLSVSENNQPVTVKTVSNVNGMALKSISECTISNSLFHDESQDQWVYLMQCDDESTDSNGNLIKKDSSDLSTYYIFVSSVNMEEYTKLLCDIIFSQLRS